MQNSVFWTRITSLYGSQVASVVLCMPNIVFSTGITSLCGSQPSSVVLCMQNSVISNGMTSLHGSQPSYVVFECKTTTFGPELLSLLVPGMTCRFVPAKQRGLDWNNWSVWVPALICGFWMQNNDLWTRITSLCGSQT